MSAGPVPVASLPETPAYDVRQTDEAYVVEVVIPFNENTLAQAQALVRTLIAALAIEDIAGLSDELASKATNDDLAATVARVEADAVVSALIFG